MIWKGELFYYFFLYIKPKMFMYFELIICIFLFFSECTKIFLLLKFEHINLPHYIYKARMNVWRKLEGSAITTILFLQMLDFSIFTAIFFGILGYELVKENFFEIEESLDRNLQLKKIELFVKFIFYLMSVYFCTVQILIKSN